MQEETINTEVAKPTLRDIFELFVADREVYRPAMNKPFLKDGKVYATDGKSMIMIDKKDCDFDYFNEFEEDAPEVSQAIPAQNTSMFLNMPFTEFNLFMTEHELESFGQDVVCDTCDGNGEVEWEFQHHTKDFECPVCHGDGLKEKVRYRKTGKKTFKHSAIVQLLNAPFSMINFYKVVQVKMMLGENVELIYVEHPTKVFRFKIGICDVLIMPLLGGAIEDDVDVLTIYPVIEKPADDGRIYSTL